MMIENGEITHYGITEGAEFLGDNLSRIALSASLLPSSITVNGTTVAPLFQYEGQNASASGFTATVGEDLTAAGSAGTFDISTGLSGPYKAYDGDGTRYYQAGNTTFGNLGDDDIALRFLIRRDVVGQWYAEKRVTSGDFEGWSLLANGAGNIQFILDVGASSPFISGLTPPTIGNWALIHLFINRDEASSNGSRLYLNGAYIGGANFSAADSTAVDSASTFTVGARSSGAAPSADPIAFFSMHRHADWFAAGTASHAEMEAIAAADTALLGL